MSGETLLKKSESVTKSDSSTAINALDRVSITPYVGNVLSEIVDDTIDQLSILGADMVPNQSIRIDDIKNRAKQYMANDPLFDPETGDLFEVYIHKLKVMKIFFDSSKIVEFLTQLRNELKFENDFSCLTNFLSEMKDSKKQEICLFAEEKQNFDAMNNLKQTLLTEQTDSQDHIHSLNEEIAILKDQSEDARYENLLRTRYTSNWESARREQNSLNCLGKENELKTTIENYRIEIEKEERVNRKIESFISENQKDMENDITEWRERYDKDSESRIFEIAVLKEKRENLAVEFAALKELFDGRQKEIDDYIEYRENKRIEDERNELERIMATRLQAWWRGLMVRRQLGEYKPNEIKIVKKKGKDKKGKKGKKI